MARKIIKRRVTGIETIIKVIELDQSEQMYSVEEIGKIAGTSARTVSSIQKYLDRLMENPYKREKEDGALFFNVEKAWEIWNKKAADVSAQKIESTEPETCDADAGEVPNNTAVAIIRLLEYLEKSADLLERIEGRLMAMEEKFDRYLIVAASTQKSNLDIRNSMLELKKSVDEIASALK